MLRLWQVTPAENGALVEDIQDAFHRLLAERDKAREEVEDWRAREEYRRNISKA